MPSLGLSFPQCYQIFSQVQKLGWEQAFGCNEFGNGRARPNGVIVHGETPQPRIFLRAPLRLHQLRLTFAEVSSEHLLHMCKALATSRRFLSNLPGSSAASAINFGCFHMQQSTHSGIASLSVARKSLTKCANSMATDSLPHLSGCALRSAQSSALVCSPWSADPAFSRFTARDARWNARKLECSLKQT